MRLDQRNPHFKMFQEVESDYTSEIFPPNFFAKHEDGEKESVGSVMHVAYEYHSLSRLNPRQRFQHIFKYRPHLLIHRSDEKLRHWSLNYGPVTTVFRDYFNPNLLRTGIYFIPCGFNERLVQEARKLPENLERDFIWSFVGNLKGDRRVMLECFRAVQPSFSSSGHSKFMEDLPISDKKVAEVYRRSFFVLCPFGSLAPDTWRILEALECGAVPVSVMMKGEVDYFKFIFGDHPFIVEKSWESASQRIAELGRDPLAIEGFRQAAISWYSEFLRDLRSDTGRLALMQQGSVVSDQFRYQKEARRSLKIRWVFFEHFILSRIEKKLRHLQNQVLGAVSSALLGRTRSGGQAVSMPRT